MKPPGWRRWVPLAALAAVCALAVVPFLADARSRGRVPSNTEVASAVTAVRGDFEDGDMVWVEPSWWVIPRHGLENIGAGTEEWPFAALPASERSDPVELLKARRVFVIAGFAREPELPEELAGLEVPRQELWRGDSVTVARHDLGPTQHLRALSDEWRAVKVARRFAPNERWTPCPFRRGEHRCGRDSWMDVALEPRVVWRRETEWLFVHPGPAGSSLEVTWRGLPRQTASGPTWLYLRTGPTLEAVRHPEGGEVVVTVAIDEVEVDRFALDPHRFWMERRAIRLPAGSEPADVVFRIESEDNAWRETALEADLFATLPAPLRAWASQVVE